ncbi:ATP-binding cassette transporter [Rhodotorula toruloides]|uniref:ATP-binding cassette transporter n=1 Tax=Rhodotorula toruloides TaxID=5286 RepID=A0A511KCM9_RHOTO|nr:ATP-binding cassette transporter [Rhodotorula toruloides]
MLVFALAALHRSRAVHPYIPQLALTVPASIASSIIALSLPRTRAQPIQLQDDDSCGERTDADREVDPDHFYPRLRRTSKAPACVTLTALLASELFRIGWEPLVFGANGWRDWVERAARIVLFTLTFSLSLLSLPHPIPRSSTSLRTHWRLTVLLFALSSSALALTLLRWLLPRSTGLSLLPPREAYGSTVYAAQMAISLASTALQLAAFVILGTTPRSAPLVHPTKPNKPIISLPSTSPLSLLLFSWISPVLHHNSSSALSEPMSEETLPAIPAAYRAREAWRKVKESKGLMEQAPRGWNPLLWRIVSVNRGLFFWQISLSVMNAVLYYVPAFFLQRLVLFLENRSSPDSDQSLRWGYVYCVGLLVGAVVESLVSGQLWFISNSMLSTGIRVQLDSLIFDKTLRRKDISSPSTSSSSSSPTPNPEEDRDEDEDEESGEGKGFKTKSALTNLFAIDSERVADFATWAFSCWDAPIEIIIGTIFLYSLIGYAALIGIAVAVLFLPLNNWASRQFMTTQDKLMATRDRRVSLMNEVLGSIRMIKFYAFERPFEKRILEARRDELEMLRWNYFLEVSFQGIWSISPILCILVSFWAYTSPLLMNRQLTPSTAFTALSVWNELRFALNVVPDVLQSALQSLVSLRRIERFLRMPEVEHLEGLDVPVSVDVADGAAVTALETDGSDERVAFDRATVTWPRHADDKEAQEDGEEGADKPFELQDLTLDFPRGEMSLVCGRLGSGKTLLLLALLGEVDVLSGSVHCPRSPPTAIALPSLDWDAYLTESNWIAPSHTAFVPQQAWLMNDSVRNNILFGLPFRKERYEKTLEACSLKSDLAILEDGDSTEIGEKGINLSGGQKARVSLARAVYSRAGVLLLDDVLSAVDAHTAAHICEQCLKGPLLEGRTVILVSHHVQLIAAGAGFVVSLENGRVAFSGSSSEFFESDGYKAIAGDDKDAAEEEPKADGLLSTSPKKPSLLGTLPRKPPAFLPPNAGKPKNKTFAQIVAEGGADSTPASSTDVTSASESGEEDESDSEPQDPTIDDDDKSKDKTSPTQLAERKPRKLVEDEGRAVGKVSPDVWKLWLSSMGGPFFWLMFVAAFGGAKLAEVADTWWLGKWSGDTGAGSTHSTNYYLILYAILSVVAAVVDTAQWFVLYAGALRSSAVLHERLLHAVLRAPLRWFDSQALGRIQNRFSKDLEGIDDSLPDNFGHSLMYCLGVVTTLSVVASSAPTFLLGFALLSVLYYRDARLFQTSAREFRRLDSVSKSPLFSIYGEAIAGVAVIRAFGSSARFMAMMLDRATTNVTFYWYLWGTNRWLSMRFSLLSSMVVALTGYVLISAGDKVDAALAGFTLTFALNISNDILYLVRRYTQLELSMVGVERTKEFSEIKQEGAEIVEPRPPAHWPTGNIEVQNLRIRYAPELPDVLHDLTFSAKAGEKIGIVGATGCGKSTLAASFFRFVEAHSGAIVVDGIDISKIGLLDLRSRLTIVPQDPVILSGTLRSTLDMFEQYEDAEIFDALRRVHLIREEERPDEQEAGTNRSVFWNLDADVAEGGSNYSTGQRQLLCMARALLKRNKILLLDEATASTDHETDELITQTIRQEFADATLLVIAHRLRTIIDFDKILLLDKGKLIEFESPAKLLEDPTSRFYALCRATGRKEFAILKKMSKGKARVTHRPRKLVRRSTAKVPKAQGSNGEA